MKIIFIDTETTGFDVQRNDIIQIAGLITENSQILDTFNLNARPSLGNYVSAKALEITKLTKDVIYAYPEPINAINAMNVLFTKYAIKGESRFILAGQNTGFDYRFLQYFWNKHKTPEQPEFNYYFNKKIIYDLQHLTKPLKKHKLLNVENVKLKTIMESLGIVADGELHNALTDIKGTFQSFYELVNRWIDIYHNDLKWFDENASDEIKHLFKKLDVKPLELL